MVGLPGLAHGVRCALIGVPGEHRLDAVEAVLGAEDEEGDGCDQHAAQHHEVLHRESADEETDGRHGHDDESGAEVVAGDDESGGSEDTGDDRDHGVAEGVHLPGLLGEYEAEPQGEGDLEELRGLDLESAEADPVRIALRLFAESWREDQSLHEESAEDREPGRILPELQRHPARRKHDDEADPGEHGLLVEVGERGACSPVVGGDR